MPAKNMCKFTNPSLPDTLTVPRFVLETDQTVMSKPYNLPNHRMILAVEGTGVFRVEEGRAEFRAGTLFFAFAGETFCVQKPQNAAYTYIDFGGTRAQELLRRFNVNKGNRAFDGFDGLIPLWNESLSRANEQTVDLAAESILLYTFSRLTGAIGEKNRLLSRILELTEEHFKEAGFSLSSLAEALSYNPKYISHLFKEKMNLSYSEYLTSLRMKYAVSLFDHGIDSVKNVALLSGFSDPLYFSNVFKKKIGVSPKEYLGNRQR